MKYTIVIMFLLLNFGCKKDSPTASSPQQSLNYGKYVGSFLLTEHRDTDSATTMKYSIQLTLSDSGWYTYSNYFPPGAGKFQIAADSIVLTDQVMHVAIGDMTLILSGAFAYTNRLDSLILVQNDMQHKRYRYMNFALSK